MDKKDITGKAKINIIKEYLNKMEEMVKISNEVMTSITDKMFNVKLSLSILKGGIIDYKRGKIGSDIHEELRNIKENLTQCLNQTRGLENKLGKSKRNNEGSVLESEISKKHNEKIQSFHKGIDGFMKKNKTDSIDKLYDLLDIILYEKDVKQIKEDVLEKWFKDSEALVNKSLQGVKSLRTLTKKVDEENAKHKEKLTEIENSTKDENSSEH